MKELWLFGSLRELGEGTDEGTMDGDSRVVGQMVESLLERVREGQMV